jgi:4-hydroxybenzoate polyprenyltransferase
MGWFIFSQSPAIPWARILPYFFLSIGFFFFTTIPDRTGDSLSGKITVAVRYGIRRTNRLAFLFFLSGFLVSLFHFDLLVLLTTGFGGFISIYFGMKPDESIISRGLKYLLAVYAFIIAWYFPWYLIAMIVLFTSTKFYYRYRFAIDYPNFKAV